MLWKTHLAFGFLSGMIAMSFVNTGNTYIFFGLVLFASLLPDIDNPESKIGRKLKIIGRIFRHRGIFHSILTGAVISGLAWHFINKPCGTALFIGYASHLLIDGFTKQGVNFLHPFSKLHLSGFIETGKAGELILFGLIIAGIILNIFRLIL